MTTDEIDPELREAAERASMLWLKEQMEQTTVDETGRVRQDYERMRAAAAQILEQAGLLKVLRGLAMDGEMSPPPPWPKTDIVPVDGGGPKGYEPAFLNVHVRTFHDRTGFRFVPLRIVSPWHEAPSPERSAKIQDMIGQAHERGVWQLKKMLNGFASKGG